MTIGGSFSDQRTAIAGSLLGVGTRLLPLNYVLQFASGVVAGAIDLSKLSAKLGRPIQGVLGYSPVTAGLAFLPVTLTIFAMVKVVPKLLGRIGPFRVLIGGLTLADLPPRHARPDRGHFADPVGKGHERKPQLRVVVPFDEQQIAIVERPRRHLDDHLPRPRHRRRPIDETQPVDGEAFHFPGFHV